VQLKILELTAGKIATLFDTSLGFRHGPKSFVDERSLVFVLVSNDPYTRLYDMDMLRELQDDAVAKLAGGVMVEQGEGLPGRAFGLPAEYAGLPDGYLALPLTVFGQILALHTAVKLGNTPDTPNPRGLVHRVVKGVTIHKFPQDG